jgi:hypothetical protein
MGVSFKPSLALDPYDGRGSKTTRLLTDYFPGALIKVFNTGLADALYAVVVDDIFDAHHWLCIRAPYTTFEWYPSGQRQEGT